MLAHVILPLLHSGIKQMKKLLLVLPLFMFSASLTGCGHSQQVIDEPPPEQSMSSSEQASYEDSMAAGGSSRSSAPTQ